MRSFTIIGRNKEEHLWHRRNLASSIEIQNVFSKGAFVTRTAIREHGQGTFGLMTIFWRNV
jgi:hypothetical protein